MSIMTCELCGNQIDTDYEDKSDGWCEQCREDEREEHGGHPPDRL